MKSRLAAGAAALVLGAGLSVAALPASAAPAAATHTVTYSSLPPSLSSPGTVLVGQTIAFKNSSTLDAITVSSTQGGWTLTKTPITVKPGQTSAPVTVSSAGTYTYTADETVLGVLPKVLSATGSFTTTSGQAAPPPDSSSPAPGSGLSGLTGGQNKAPATPPTAGSGGGSGQAGGSGGAASSGSGGSGSLSFSDTGGSGSTGSYDKAQFGSGSGDFPNLPGGVLAPEAPQAGTSDGGLPPEIATYPTAGTADGAFGQPAPSPSPNRSTDTIANASQDVGSASGSSVTGPAAVAAVLLALVAVGLSRAWIDQRPLHRR